MLFAAAITISSYLAIGARAEALVLDSDPLSRVYELKPNYQEYIENSVYPGFLYKFMNKVSAADRKLGPGALREVSVSARRRWLEEEGNGARHALALRGTLPSFHGQRSQFPGLFKR